MRCKKCKLLEQADERIKELEKALKFYAGKWPNDDLGDYTLRITEDCGDTARKALGMEEIG